MRGLSVLAIFIGLAACRGPDPQAEWLEAIVEITTPADAGSRFPHLAPLPGGAVMSWLEPDSAGGMSLRHSTWTGGAMTLRSALIGPDARKQGADIQLDGRVCDCCQTDAALTREGPVVVYRDRSEGEVRDIALVRLTASGWSSPIHVASDGWHVEACPVNGPAVDARDDTVVVAWFTAPDRPRIRLAFSDDGGRSFSHPIEVATGRVAGRVDVVLLPDGRAAVSWLAETKGSAEIRVQPLARDGPAGVATVVSRSDVARSSGFPQMVLADGALLFAWTRSGEQPMVSAAVARLR